MGSAPKNRFDWFGKRFGIVGHMAGASSEFYRNPCQNRSVKAVYFEVGRLPLSFTGG